MANAPNRSRTKRTPASLADRLYPKSTPQDASTGDEAEADAPEETGTPRTPMQAMADNLYPENSQDDADDDGEDDTGETDQDADEPEGVDEEEDGGAADDASDDDEQQAQGEGKAAKNNAKNGKVAPKPINGSKSESYDTHVKTGGSRSWRNNNPGNIEYRGQADTVGVEKGGRFAKYATPEAGMSALKNMLSTTYKDMPVTEAIKKYAPRKDNNDPETYARFLAKHGVDPK